MSVIIHFKCDNCECNYRLKVNNRNTKTRCEICSKFKIKTPERRHCRRSGVFIVNFEYISHLVLVFLLLTLGREMPDGLIKFRVKPFSNYYDDFNIVNSKKVDLKDVELIGKGLQRSPCLVKF